MTHSCPIRVSARLASSLAVALLLVAGPATAQETGPSEPQEREDRLRFELSLEGMLFDNFFQAPDDQEATGVEALRAMGTMELRPDPSGPVRLVLGAGRTAYGDGLDDATRLIAGVRMQQRPHELDLLGGYETNRPILDVGDELETADVLFLDAEYGYRLASDWEIKGLLGVQDQTFEVSSSKDNTILGVGPAVRYRGFGSEISPEIGAQFGGRSATDPTEDHSQTDLYLKLRSSPADDLYLTFRFRRRFRNYSTDDVADSNFGREDRRNQFTALAVYPTNRPLTLTVYYAYQDAESTLATRTFTTQMLIAGLTYTLE